MASRIDSVDGAHAANLSIDHETRSDREVLDQIGHLEQVARG